MTDKKLLWPDILLSMFDAQEVLMAKFRDIEHLPNPPLSLHHPHAQKIMKDFAWRITEELCESFDAWIDDGDPVMARAKALEELADATHFFIELLIFAGITAAQCLERFPMYPQTKRTGPSAERHWSVVCRLGLAMNCLKNRPWKSSIVPTDEGTFRMGLLLTYTSLIQLWAEAGCGMTDVQFHYFNKNRINHTRIATGE